jgi:hypothetical protein
MLCVSVARRQRERRQAYFNAMVAACGAAKYEGDGWVNWSGLATLLSQMADPLERVMERLLVPPQ